MSGSLNSADWTEALHLRTGWSGRPILTTAKRTYKNNFKQYLGKWPHSLNIPTSNCSNKILPCWCNLRHRGRCVTGADNPTTIHRWSTHWCLRNKKIAKRILNMTDHHGRLFHKNADNCFLLTFTRDSISRVPCVACAEERSLSIGTVGVIVTVVSQILIFLRDFTWKALVNV